MDVDQQNQMHLDALMKMEKPEEFGPAFVQRYCRIGYNNACHVLERGVSSRLLIKASVPYHYKVAIQMGNVTMDLEQFQMMIGAKCIQGASNSLVTCTGRYDCSINNGK